MTQPTTTVHATVHFPIIDPLGTIEDQRKKVMEELDEFMDEIQSGKSITLMAAELNDVYQAFVTLVHIMLKDDEQAVEYIEDANKEHRAKIERYKVERGWT